MKLHRLFFTALLGLGFAGSSHAQVLLFNNVSQTDNGAEGFNTLETRLATDFVTDGSSWNLKSVRALMANPSLNVTHTVTFRLFSDDGSGKPGSLVGVFGQPASLPPNSSGLFLARTLPVTSIGIHVEANTRYWLVGQVNELSPSTVIWRNTGSEGTDNNSAFHTVSGTEMLTSVDSGTSYDNSGAGNRFFQLSFAVIPEPQTWVALLATLGTFGTLRWWANRKGIRATN